MANITAEKYSFLKISIKMCLVNRYGNHNQAYTVRYKQPQYKLVPLSKGLTISTKILNLS